MTVRVSHAEAARLQGTTTTPKPRRPREPSGPGGWECGTCGVWLPGTSWAAAERHSDGHGGGRLTWKDEAP